MTAKLLRIVVKIPGFPPKETRRNFSNRKQVSLHVSRYISRETIQKSYGISSLTSDSQFVQDLIDAELLTLERTHKSSKKYLPDRRGHLEVLFEISRETSVRFVCRLRSHIYPQLKACLYPTYSPTDRAFRLHLMALALGCGITTNDTEEEAISKLMSGNVLTIKEKQYAPK